MELSDLIQKRYSCRDYSSQKVSKDTLESLIELAHMAPSAVNFQPWEVIAITQDEGLEKVWDCYGKNWIKSAPVVFIICGNHQKSWKRADGKDFADVDAAIFTDHLTLAATNKGLATCWVCNFDREKLTSHFNLPNHIEPIVVLPLGYAADGNMPAKKRLSVNGIIHWDKY